MTGKAAPLENGSSIYLGIAHSWNRSRRWTMGNFSSIFWREDLLLILLDKNQRRGWGRRKTGAFVVESKSVRMESEKRDRGRQEKGKLYPHSRWGRSRPRRRHFFSLVQDFVDSEKDTITLAEPRVFSTSVTLGGAGDMLLPKGPCSKV